MGKLLPNGTIAPNFKLHVTPDQTISLSELKGKTVILAFYPADWSPVCSDEMVLFNEILPEFHKHKAELLGISVDGYWCHSAFAKANKLHFPLLADFEPKGQTAKDYGVYSRDEGICERALYVIDKKGKIAWGYISPMGENPGADGVLEALENLEKQEKTYANSKSSSYT